jgi:hypothetical protein
VDLEFFKILLSHKAAKISALVMVLGFDISSQLAIHNLVSQPQGFLQE